MRSEDKSDPARKKRNPRQEPEPNYPHDCRVFKRWEKSVHTYSLAQAKAFIALDDALKECLSINKHWRAHARKQARITGEVEDLELAKMYRRDLRLIKDARREFFIYHMWDYRSEMESTAPGRTDKQ